MMTLGLSLSMAFAIAMMVAFIGMVGVSVFHRELWKVPFQHSKKFNGMYGQTIGLYVRMNSRYNEYTSISASRVHRHVDEIPIPREPALEVLINVAQHHRYCNAKGIPLTFN